MVDKGDGKKAEEKLQNIEDMRVTDSQSEYYARFSLTLIITVLTIKQKKSQ